MKHWVVVTNGLDVGLELTDQGRIWLAFWTGSFHLEEEHHNMLTKRDNGLLQGL